MTAEPSKCKVYARCVSCRATRYVKAYEVAEDDMPTCEKCGDVMVAERAEVRRR